MPLYLLDANVLIDANRDYYPMIRVPEFWEWLVHEGSASRVKIPIEMRDEIRTGNDALGEWIRGDDVKRDLVLDEESDPDVVTQVTLEGYAGDLTDEELEKLGQDPFLIAYAMADPAERYVVTTEVSKPSKTRANRHIPDVCTDFGIRTLNTYEFVRELDFRTNWRRG